MQADAAPINIYQYRGFPADGDTVVSAASLDVVTSVYGGGGLKGEAGLEKKFGGSAFFRNETTGECFLGIWGAKNASQFRNDIRQSSIEIDIIHERPPARLTWYKTKKKKQTLKITNS